MKQLSILLLILFTGCALLKDGGEDQPMAVIEGNDSSTEFPGRYSISGDEDYLDKIKDLCSSSEDLDENGLLEKALGCLYEGELRKSYFLHKSLLANFNENKTKKALILNNMGVIQMNWGHRDLAESLFSESIESNRNIVNTFNILKLQVEEAAFSDQTLIPFLENASFQGRDLDLLKAKLAVVLKKNETAILNYDYAASSESEVLNYLYFLTKIRSDVKFKEVAAKFEEKLKENRNYLILKRKMNL